MTNYCVGCDNIVGGESNIISKVAKVLEKAGNSCEKLNVGPNFVQSKGLSTSSKGKVAVFIVGGSDVGTYVDFKMGLERGYYHYKYIWFAFASWTATTDKWITENGLKNTGLVRAHDDNFSSQSDIAPYLGKSADYFFQQNKSKMNYVWGQTPEELANKILNGGSDDSSNSSSGSNIKEAIKDVMYGWDGEAELFVRGDTVHIRKIPSPSTATLSLVEGENIKFDSTNINDVNPSTTNYITCEYEDKILTIQDDYLIKRFGKIEETVSVDDTVSNLNDAKEFLEREWAKIKRDNGHSLECTVRGDSKWKQGLWCRVYLPSFKLDDYMYITKVSEDDEKGDWKVKLKLVDYPPGFGEPASSNDGDESEDDEDNSDTEYDSVEEAA